MAVLDDLEARIRVNGQRLTEYDNDDPEENSRLQTVVKYVAAPTDTPFAFHIRLSKNYQMTNDGLSLRFIADGNPITGLVCLKEDLQAEDTEYVIRGVRFIDQSGASMLRTMHFTQIEAVDTVTNTATTSSVSSNPFQASTTTSIDDLQELGLITIKAFRVKNIRKLEATYSRNTTLKPLSIRSNQLEARKITQSVTLGPPEPCGKYDKYHSDLVDYSPIATFIFKYRTKESLDQLNVTRTNLEDIKGESVDQLTQGECQHEQRRLSSGSSGRPINPRRSREVTRRAKHILSQPRTPENSFQDLVSSRRSSSSSNFAATPVSARSSLSREAPEPVTPRSPTAFSPRVPVSIQHTPTTSTISTIPEESPSENTPRASGRKRTHSTSSPSILGESASKNSAMATAAASSGEHDATEPQVQKPLRKRVVPPLPHGAPAETATVRQSVRRLQLLPAAEREEKKRKVEKDEADEEHDEDEEMAGSG
ncbi:MAG: hypothetical protein Q9184_005477 [Pyrenodesmia sp. 2 TL-2023]